MDLEDLGGPGTVDSRQALARELTFLRLRAGLSVRELATRLDVPTATVGDYVSGRHLPGPARFPLFRRLLAECGIDDEVLIQQWLKTLARVRSSSDRRSVRPRSVEEQRACATPEPRNAGSADQPDNAPDRQDPDDHDLLGDNDHVVTDSVETEPSRLPKADEEVRGLPGGDLVAARGEPDLTLVMAKARHGGTSTVLPRRTKGIEAVAPMSVSWHHMTDPS